MKREGQAEYQAKRRSDRKRLGLCASCGASSPTFWACESCRSRAAEKKKAARIANPSRCMSCGGDAGAHRRCVACRAKTNATGAERVAAGLCRYCGAPSNGKRRCPECKTKESARLAAKREERMAKTNAEKCAARRERLLAQGKCGTCAGESDGHARCAACRENDRASYRTDRTPRAPRIATDALPITASMAETLADRIRSARATIHRVRGAGEKTGFVSAAILEKIDAALRGE